MLHLLGAGGENWTRTDAIALVAVVATVVGALLAASLTREANSIADRGADIAERGADIAASAQVKKADLKLKRATPYIGEAIDAQKLGSAGEPEGSVKVRPAMIDIILQNLGNTPGLVTEVKFDFSTIDNLDPCLEPGGGDLTIEADYEIMIPSYPPPEMPYSITKKVQYELSQDKIERFTLSVGPEVSGGDDGPWYAVFSISLKVDGESKPLEAGPFVVVRNSRHAWAHLNEATRQWEIRPAKTVNEYVCQIDAARKLRAVSPGGVEGKSPEFAGLERAVSDLEGRPRPTHPPGDLALRAGDCFNFIAPQVPRRATCDEDTFKVVARIPYTIDAERCKEYPESNDHAVFPFDDDFDEYTLCLKSRY